MTGVRATGVLSILLALCVGAVGADEKVPDTDAALDQLRAALHEAEASADPSKWHLAALEARRCAHEGALTLIRRSMTNIARAWRTARPEILLRSRKLRAFWLADEPFKRETSRYFLRLKLREERTALLSTESRMLHYCPLLAEAIGSKLTASPEVRTDSIRKEWRRAKSHWEQLIWVRFNVGRASSGAASGLESCVTDDVLSDRSRARALEFLSTTAAKTSVRLARVLLTPDPAHWHRTSAALGVIATHGGTDDLVEIIEFLRHADTGRLWQDAHEILESRSAQSVPLSRNAWVRWWNESGPAPASATSALISNPAERPRRLVTLFGIPIYAGRIEFVIDRGYKMADRWDEISSAVADVVSDLDPRVSFNITLIGNGQRKWSTRMKLAKPATRKQAAKWLRRQKVDTIVGGVTKLTVPLGNHIERRLDERGAPTVDTLIFVSSGWADPRYLMPRCVDWGPSLRLRIHTVGVQVSWYGVVGDENMNRIADLTQGRHVLLKDDG